MSFEEYYTNQCGHGAIENVYQGRRYQKGHGIGNVFGGILRAALPVLKKTAVGIGKDLLRTGARQGSRLLEDVVRGNSFKQSLKRRAIQGGEDLVNKRLKRNKTPTRSPRKVKRRKTVGRQTARDIFH